MQGAMIDGRLREAQPHASDPVGPDVQSSQPEAASPSDLFALGRAAAAAAGGRAIFCRSRQLLPTGAWRGPRDAAESCVEEADLPALGGLEAAAAAGARTLLATSAEGARAGAALGMRVLWRLSYDRDDEDAAQAARFAEINEVRAGGVRLDGVIPTPVGEPMGIHTLRLMTACRLELGLPHVVADFVKLGHRLAQMSLGFGADELYGPIMPERALRLGANAHNPVMTRKEAAVLIRGAGLTPCERLAGGAVEDFQP
jgi:hypothetical protein